MEMEEEKKRRKRKSSSSSSSWSTESSSSSINNLDDGCLMHIFSFLSPIPGMLPLLSFFLFLFKTLFAFPLPLLGFQNINFWFWKKILDLPWNLVLWGNLHIQKYRKPTLSLSLSLAGPFIKDIGFGVDLIHSLQN